MDQTKEPGNPADHLANERTFLAWVRTSIGIMAFGFVVVKFSLFVKQLSLMLSTSIAVSNKGYSVITGIVLVGFGSIMSILSFIRYKQTEKQLRMGTYQHSSVLLTVLTAFICLISILLIVYLAETA